MTVIFASNKILLRHIEALTRIRALYNNPYDFYPGEIKMKKSLFITTVALVVPFLFSCSNTDEEIIPVSSIALSESDVTLKVGEEKRVTPTISPENATDRSLVWTSSHPNSVTAVGGLLHAYSVPKDTDKVTITAEDRNKTVSASVSVTVLPADPAKAVEADGITISKEVVSLVLDGDKAVTTISATVTPFNFEDRDVVWTSSAPSVVSLSDIVQPNPEGTTLEAKKSSKVTLTGLVEGSAKVTAKCGDFSVSCAVTVSNKPDSIQVFSYGQKEVSVEKGEKVTNPLTVLPYDALDEVTVTYESSNPSIASVSSTGEVTGVEESNDPVTITAKVDGTAFYDTYTVYVTHRYENYLHMKPKDSNAWINVDLDVQSATTYKVNDRHFNRGDILCFCIGKTDWYKYPEVKEDSGQGVNFTSDEDNIKILKSGNYTITVQTDPSNSYVLLEAGSLDVQKAKLTYVNGSTQEKSVTELSLKPGSASEYKFTRTINKDDYFYVEFDGEYYAKNEFKGGGVGDLFDEYSTQSLKYAKCNETHSYTVYIQTNPDLYDEHGKSVYVRADYFKYSKPSTNEWLTVDCDYKEDGSNGHPEYYKTGLKLEKGANLLARINGEYYKYDLLEDGGKKAWTYQSDEVYKNIVVSVAGSYDIYCKTPDDEATSCTSIYLDGSVDTAKNYAEILRKNQSIPEAQIGLALKPGFLNEFEMENVSLAAGDKIRFFIGDGYELRLKNPAESSKFKAVDSNGYFECKTAGAFDLYIKFKDDDPTQLGLWVADHIVVNYVTYTLKDYPSWYMDYSPHFYAWAWPDGGSGKLYEAEVNGSGHIIFTIPDYCVKANFYRCNTTYAETVCPGDDDAAVWNKYKDYVLSGHDDYLSTTLFGS